MGSLLKNQSVAENIATLERLSCLDVTVEHTERIRKDAFYARRVASCMRNAGLPPSRYHRDLRRVMDERVFGIDEWEHLLGQSFSNPDRCELEKLEYPKGPNGPNHFACLGLQQLKRQRFTLIVWDRTFGSDGKGYDLKPMLFDPPISRTDWANRQGATFNKAACQTRWYLSCCTRVDAVTCSMDAALAALPTGYRLPSTVEAVTLLIAQGLRNGTFYDGSICTSDVYRDHQLYVCALPRSNGVGGCLVTFDYCRDGGTLPSRYCRPHLYLLAIKKN